jgi:hypothetical protein
MRATPFRLALTATAVAGAAFALVNVPAAGAAQCDPPRSVGAQVTLPDGRKVGGCIDLVPHCDPGPCDPTAAPRN